MMSVDGTSKGGYGGAHYGHLAHTSSSPVAKINGRLLTGNGLQAFQLKRQALSTSAAPGGDLPGVGLLAPSHAAFLYESRGSAIAIDLPSMG
jgi:hypothetical protein